MGTASISIALPADLLEDAERLRNDARKTPDEFYGEAIRRYLAAVGRRQDGRQGAMAFARALDAVAGVWSDHPAFRGNGSVKAWRKELWAVDQARLESSAG